MLYLVSIYKWNINEHLLLGLSQITIHLFSLPWSCFTKNDLIVFFIFIIYRCIKNTWSKQHINADDRCIKLFSKLIKINWMLYRLYPLNLQGYDSRGDDFV